MFENDLVEMDAAATLAAAESNEHALITAEIRRLQIAAHWADLHPGDGLPHPRLPGTEHPVRLGGHGTATVADFASAELGCVLRISDGAACRLIADALDLRHRLPLIWQAAQSGRVPAYQGRHIATATRHLNCQQAGVVDQRIAPALGAVSWSRLHNLLEAAIIEADPDGAKQRAAAAAQERFVRLGRRSEHGLKMIIARATAGDALCFKAVIDRLAEILGRDGDGDPVDVRRSKAIGILAQPVQALQLLFNHRNDDWDGPAEPAEPTDTDQELTEDDTQPDLDGDQEAQPTADAAAAEESDADLAAAEQPDADVADGQCAHKSLQILPPPFDPSRARPRAVIYVHLSAEAVSAGHGVCRMEEVGPVLLSQLRDLLEGFTINLKPVIDLPAGHSPIDSYEIPASLREQILLRHPADVFPYASAVSRRIQIDHTIPYLSPDKGGPPGQTRIGNLGPHVCRSHNFKTHGR